jgi:D-alanine-D-alanine ligase
VLKAAGVPVVPWVTSRAAISPVTRPWSAHPRAGLPAFVKPARAGSSVGVSKVSEWSELDAALETAFAEDGTVLVEQAVVGREVECGVLAGRDGAAPR